MQQWARRYLDVSHHAGRNLKERAQIHSFLASGMTNFHFNPMVQTLPVLVHLSLLIFFAGLVVYLFNINQAVFSAVACCVALSSATFGFITFMPFIWLDSPYYTPFTQPAWFLYTRCSYYVVRTLYDIYSIFPFRGHYRIWTWVRQCYRQKARGNLSLFLDAISKKSEYINLDILVWTIYGLYEDDKLENVFEFTPGFLKSESVARALRTTPLMIEGAMREFLSNTLLSNSVPESVKVRRLTKCLDVARQVLLPVPSDMFLRLVELDWGRGRHSVEIGRSLRTWDQGSDRRFTPYIRGVIAVIIAKVRERNLPWATFARHNLPMCVPEIVFRDYSSNSSSVLLANLVYFTRHANPDDPFTIAVVRSLSKFNIRDTHPDLQRNFCAMWNELVQAAQSRNSSPDNITPLLLREMGHLYAALHQGTDAALPDNFNAFNIPSGSLDIQSPYPPCRCRDHGYRADLEHYAPDKHIAEAVGVPSPLPVKSFGPIISRPGVASPNIIPPSSPSAYLDATQPTDDPTIHTMPIPITQSPYPLPPAMPQPHLSPVTPSDPPANTSQQATAHRCDISSDLNHSTPVTISIPQPNLPPSAGSATASVSSPMQLVVPFQVSPPPLPNRIAPTSPPPFPMPLLSRPDQATSDHEIPTSSSTNIVPPIPPVAHQSSPERDPIATSSAATDDAPDKSSV